MTIARMRCTSLPGNGIVDRCGLACFCTLAAAAVLLLTGYTVVFQPRRTAGRTRGTPKIYAHEKSVLPKMLGKKSITQHNLKRDH